MAENVEGQVVKEEKVDEIEEVVTEPVGKEEPAELSETEKQAKAQGWDPEYDGPNKRSAREFLDRGELLSKIKSQGSELRQIKETLGALSEHNKQVYMAGYQRAVQELRQLRAKAIEDGDTKNLAVIEDKLDAAKDEIRRVQSMPNTPATAPGPTEEFKSFTARNEWYRETPSMRHWAHGMAIEFAKVNPDAGEEDVYKFIEKEVRKEFPAKFGRSAPPSPDGDGKRGETKPTKTGGTAAFDKLMATLPEDQAKAAKDMVKRKVLTAEKYVEDYEKIGRY